MLGALLGGLTGAQPTQSTPQQQSNGLDLSDLLAAGMGYMQAKQQGQTGMQALAQAFLAGSGMGNTQHRIQSTAMVVQSFLNALGSMNK
jgi:lipoprotein signal peptidase